MTTERESVDVDWPTRQYDDPVLALATVFNEGPDGQDWMDAQLKARERLPELHDEQQWMLVPIQEVALALSVIDVAEVWEDWSEETSIGRLNKRVQAAASDIYPGTAESQRFIGRMSRAEGNPA